MKYLKLDTILETYSVSEVQEHIASGWVLINTYVQKVPDNTKNPSERLYYSIGLPSKEESKE